MTARQHYRYRAFRQDRENLLGDAIPQLAREGTGMAVVHQRWLQRVDATASAHGIAWHRRHDCKRCGRAAAVLEYRHMIAETTRCARESVRMR
jgi:hypothetical protein